MKLALLIVIILAIGISYFFLIEYIVKKITRKQRINKIKNIMYENVPFKIIYEKGHVKLILNNNTYDL